MKFSAVIFDLNGTILEDEDEYGKAFVKVLKALNVEVNNSFPQEKGIGVKENWQRLIKKHNIKTEKSVELLVKETQEEYLKEISEVTIRSGFNEFVESLKDSQIKIALATSNTWEQTDRILDTLGLQDIFDVTTTGDEVTYNKPDPDIFLLTADKLGIERSDCLIIEDSLAGIEAAKRAGMKVIAISSEEDSKIFSKADLVVESFSDITAQVIDQL